MSIQYVMGDEPYWVDSEIRKAVEGVNPEIDLLKADQLNEEVLQFLNSFSFIGVRRAAIVTVGDLSEADKPILKGFRCPADAELVIRARAFDQRKTFFKEIKKAGLVTLCTKAALGRKLDAFLMKKAQELGIQFAEGAFSEFLFLENYQDAEEVNCYSLIEDLRSLAGASEDGMVDEELVKRLIPSHHQGNPFVVASMIQSGNVKGLLEQAQSLSGQEIPSLAALLREYRIAWKLGYFKLAEIGVARNTLEISREEAADGIRILTRALRSMKSDAPKGSVLAETYLQLAKK